MPVYEYICQSCRKDFEKLVRSMSGEEKITCPECGSAKTTRALSVFAVGAEGSRTSPAADPMCGRCGGAPGSCQMQ
jgi:putative FmdB family regulatory protein